MMLSYASLSDVPEETRERMSVSFGSRQLLHAIRGEPLEIPPRNDHWVAPKPARVVKLTPRPKSMKVMPEFAVDLIAATEEAFSLKLGTLLGRGRTNDIAQIRSIAIRILRDRMRGTEHVYSTSQIGTIFGRDHSTICHALSMFPIYCRNEPIAQAYATLSKRFS